MLLVILPIPFRAIIRVRVRSRANLLKQVQRLNVLSEAEIIDGDVVTRIQDIGRASPVLADSQDLLFQLSAGRNLSRWIRTSFGPPLWCEQYTTRSTHRLTAVFLDVSIQGQPCLLGFSPSLITGTFQTFIFRSARPGRREGAHG